MTPEFPIPKKIRLYTAIANQTGTTAPTISQLQNNIGNIIWTRNSQGRFYGTLTGAFPETKTKLSANQTAAVDRNILLSRIDDDTILLIQPTFTSPWDPVDELANVQLEIKIYLKPLITTT